MREKYEDDFKAGMGAEAIKELLQEINLDELSENLRAELKDASGRRSFASSSALRLLSRSASPTTIPRG